MIIKSYHTTKFAGLTNRSLKFEDGLNVILGPNESGKSTTIDGIHSTLFKNTKLNKSTNKDKNFLYKYMPVSGGDFINGTIEFETSNGSYKLSREWGHQGSSQLVTYDGNIIKSEDEINNYLSNILVFGESTYTNIVFAKQKDLKKSLDNIINDSETTSELIDILRKSFMQLDGVNIDKIEYNIKEEIEALYKRWDKDKNYPENNRGINNPYKTGLGKIVQTFYKKEYLKKLMEKAYITERKYEEISKNILNLENEKEIKNNKKIKLEEIEDDINKFELISTEINSLNQIMKDLIEVNKNWPVLEHIINENKKELKELDSKLLKLSEDRKKIKKINKKKDLETTLANINEIDSKINALKPSINNLNKLNQGTIDKLYLIDKDITLLEAEFNTGEIIAKVVKNTDKPLIIKNNYLTEISLDEDNSFKASGTVSINYNNDLNIEIKTKEIDYEEISNKLNLLKSDKNSILNKLSVESIEDAKVKLYEKNDLVNKAKSLKSQRDFILKNMDIDKIKEELDLLKDIDINIDENELEEMLDFYNNKKIELVSSIKSNEGKLKDWSSKYGSFEELFKQILENQSLLAKKEKEIESLSKLPEEFESVKEFKDTLYSLKISTASIQTKLDTLYSDYYDIKLELLEETYEEIKKQYIAEEDKFTELLTKGETLLKVQKVFMDTKDYFFSNPMKSLVEKFQSLLKVTTDGDYSIGDINENFEIKIQNQTSHMPIDLLSAGTYDAVALALRFALISYIYNDNKGYVILDDCLVDLDPNRKKQSIDLIKEFSKKYQIIFTTCDPETANLLGGNIINLK